jgi:hypothetical protein
LNQNPQCIESLLANNIFSDNQSLSLVSLSQNADAPSELFELLCEERSFRSVLAARQSTALLSNRFTAFVQQCAADFVHNQAAIIAPHLKQTNNSVEVIPVASYSLSPAQAQSRARWGVILTRLLSDTQTSASLLQNNTLVTNLIALLEQEVKAGIVTSAPAPPSSEAATLSFQKGRPLSYEAAIAAASWESKPMASQNERVAAVHLPALALRIALDQSKNKSGTKSEPAISAATCALLSSIRYSSVEPLPPMDWCTARSHSPASPTQQRRVRLSDPGSPKFHDPSDDSRSFVASALSASTPSLDCPTAFLPSAAGLCFLF